MDDADAKENRPVTPSNPQTRGAVVGSGSTWGAKERGKFRIKTTDAVDVKEFVEEKWFDFTTLDASHVKGISRLTALILVLDILRMDLIILSKKEILSGDFDRMHYLSVWGSFRSYLQEIYTPETTSGADIRAGLAREKREKNRGEVMGRKETGIASPQYRIYCRRP